MQRRQIVNEMKKLLAAGAMRSACMGANSACGFVAYQPKEVEAVKRMRRF